MKRRIVISLERIDRALDWVLYRPALVRAFLWLPRWWMCDLSRLSIALDDRWRVGWWDAHGIYPGRPCDACGRRASIHVVGGPEDDEGVIGDYLETHPVQLCGWCEVAGPINDDAELERALARARIRSVAWRWRRRPTV